MGDHLILLERSGETAAIFFAARGNGREFGFYRIAHRLPVTALLVKDPSNNWYNAGIEGVGANVQEIAKALRAAVGARERRHHWLFDGRLRRDSVRLLARRATLRRPGAADSPRKPPAAVATRQPASSRPPISEVSLWPRPRPR